MKTATTNAAPVVIPAAVAVAADGGHRVGLTLAGPVGVTTAAARGGRADDATAAAGTATRVGRGLTGKRAARVACAVWLDSGTSTSTTTTIPEATTALGRAAGCSAAFSAARTTLEAKRAWCGSANAGVSAATTAIAISVSAASTTVAITVSSASSAAIGSAGTGAGTVVHTGGGGATAANGRSGSRRRSAVRMTTLAGGAGCSAGSLAAMTVVRGATMAARAVMTLGGAAVCSVASLAMLPVIWTAMTAAATTATAATVGVAAVVAGTGGGYQTSHGRTAAPGAGGVC